MPREFVLPDLGEGITEAQIVRVLVKDGERIAEDQYLMEVETDKAAVEIPSPYSGIAQTVHVKEGQTINVGDVIVTFDDGPDGAATASQRGADSAKAPVGPAKETPAPARDRTRSPQEAPSTAPARMTKASAAPAVRKLAREMGIDLGSIAGTGPGGRITREDVTLQAQGASPAEAAGRVASPSPRQRAGLGSRGTQHSPPPGIADADKWGPIRREPLNQIRKTIANRMSRSASTIPHVTHTDEADITELDRMRRHLNEATNNEPKLTVMSFVICATCIALRKFPIFNASFDEEGEQIIYKEYVNMGIAVDAKRGLIVPVIRNIDQLSLQGIAQELRSIADRIRADRFGIEDLRGGTFTITNVGALGGLFTTPIINHPEVAILGLGRSRMVPVIRDNQITQALMLPISVSFDHRATDGAKAARFTREIISYLETPGKFLLD